MFNSNRLTDEQLVTIGQRLKLLIGNNENPNQLRDYKKAAVLFYSINNLGYVFYSNELERAIEKSNVYFSEKITEDLKHIAESMTHLNNGLNDSYVNDYKITAKELAL